MERIKTSRITHLTTVPYTTLVLRELKLPTELTACSRVLPEKLAHPQLVKKFPAFHETLKFITTFTKVCHLSLSWASSIQFIPPHPTSWRSISILSSYLHLVIPSVLFPSGFPLSPVCTFLLPQMWCYLPHPSQSWFDQLNNIWWEVQVIDVLVM